jgi:hypothetical protein
VSIVTRLQAGQPGVQLPAASYSVGGGRVLSVGVKWLGCEFDRLPSGAEIEIEWRYTSALSVSL